jgi:anti-sigma regulatory factor (Ser/Thr protein kinase)
VVQQVHGAVVQRLIEVESFVTAVYARFDSRDCTITFVDCGHPKALYVPGDSDRAHRLVGSSLPFGFLQDYPYRQDTAPLAEGDTVVLYTDGVTEVFSPEGEMFGEARLQQLVEQLARRPPAKIIDGIRDSLERHAKSTAFRDDLTLVALRVRSTRTQAKTAPKEESLNIARDLAELSRVRDAISEFLHSSHASPASVFVGRVQLAVQEALTNILRHTTGRAPADGVEIRIKREGPGVAVTLLYEGDELFRPTSTRLPEVEDYPSGGFGLYLIQESVDSFEYDRSEDGRMKILLYAEPPDDPDTSSESAVPSDS